MGRPTVFLLLIVVCALLLSSGCTRPPSRSNVRSDSGSSSVPVAPAETTKTPAADTLLEVEPGTRWESVMYVPHRNLPLSLPLAGPWIVEKLQPEKSWTVNKTVFETVALADAPEAAQFSRAAYAVMETAEAGETFHFRSLSRESVLEYGFAAKAGGTWKATDFGKPTVLYPLDMKVGERRPIFEDANQRIAAEAIAVSSLTIPAGTFENTMLVRFDYTHKTQKDRLSHHYFLYAPRVGLVAQITAAEGQTKGVDVTSVSAIQLITAAPEKMR